MNTVDRKNINTVNEDQGLGVEKCEPVKKRVTIAQDARDANAPPHRLQLHRLQVGDDGCTKFACGSVVNLDGSYRIGRGQRSNQPFAARLLDGSLPSSLLFLQSSSSWDK